MHYHADSTFSWICTSLVFSVLYIVLKGHYYIICEILNYCLLLHDNLLKLFTCIHQCVM